MSKEGYIYKITDGIKYYIGSTTRPVNKRFWEHSSKRKIKLPCFNYFESVNWLNVKIENIETVLFENKTELLRKENNYIKLNDECCLNTRKSLETKEEYNARHNAWCKEKKACECGSLITRGHLARHKKICHFYT